MQTRTRVATRALQQQRWMQRAVAFSLLLMGAAWLAM
jgi:hypothetical protein